MVEHELSNYDPAEALDNLEGVAMFLADAFETGDKAYVAKALGIVARSKGLAELSTAASVPREQLHAAFESGEIELDTLLEVMKVVDLHLPGDWRPATIN